jgi:hypothetical protein
MTDNFDRKELWDDFDINPDIVVRTSVPPCASIVNCDPQPFTHDFPNADIHKLLSCDLLHRVIKGTFKDHLVTWVGEYLKDVHGKSKAAKIMADIDQQ